MSKDKTVKRILISCVCSSLLLGCAQKQERRVLLYQDATGETAKLRVIGFTDYTTLHQIKSCTDSSDLRDMKNEKRNPARVVDKGFRKATPAPGNVPLDYQERLLPAEGWIDIRSALFASDGGICTLNTSWFKPKKDALYEVRNRLNKKGNLCSMEFVQIDQMTGRAERVETHKYVAEFLPCQTLTQ